MKSNKFTRMLGTAALAGGLATGALAQDSEKSWLSPENQKELEELIQAEVSADLRYAMDNEGFHSQNLFTLKYGDAQAKLLLGNQVDSRELGFDFKNNDFRINAGYLDNGLEQGHISGTLYLDDNFDRFLGTSVQFMPNGTFGTFFAGHDFGDLNLQGTFDTEGNVRAVGTHNLGEGLFGFGGGINPDGETDFGVSYNRGAFWANARFGESRNLDAKLVLGNVPDQITKYWGGVQGNGVNDLGDMFYDTDRTFKFSIGDNPEFDFYGPESKFLGSEAGDSALEARLKEDEYLRLKAGHRLGDIGFMNDSYIAGGADFGLEGFDFSGADTYFGQAGFRPEFLDDGELSFKVQERDGEYSAGVYFQLSFK